MKSFSLPKSIRQGRILPRVALLCFLLVLIVIGAVPGYLTGHWRWAQLPPVATLPQLTQLRNKGLELPGWKILEQRILKLGGHEWSIQSMEGNYPKPILLLLLPQITHKSQPQVEWMDLRGFEKWRTDSYSQLKFTSESSQGEKLTTGAKNKSTAQVEARFFRAYPPPELLSARPQPLSPELLQTFAVVQWYALPQGGSPNPSYWFWADQRAQLHQGRTPWVAVCLQIPIEPLGNIEKYRPLAESLSKMIQTALMASPLAQVSRDK